MTLTLKGQVDITFVAAYAPTAIATAEDKDEFYSKLTTITNRYKKKRPMYIGADINAKLLHPGDGDEGIGQHVFTEGAEGMREGTGVEDNRYRMQEYLTKTKPYY